MFRNYNDDFSDISKNGGLSNSKVIKMPTFARCPEVRSARISS